MYAAGLCLLKTFRILKYGLNPTPKRRPVRLRLTSTREYHGRRSELRAPAIVCAFGPLRSGIQWWVTGLYRSRTNPPIAGVVGIPLPRFARAPSVYDPERQ